MITTLDTYPHAATAKALMAQAAYVDRAIEQYNDDRYDAMRYLMVWREYLDIFQRTGWTFIEFTTHEGGFWFPLTFRNLKFFLKNHTHSLRFFGKEEWDEVNGWRSL